MKSVLIAIQPYWVFLIIATKMGWEIDQEKTVEVRKSFPKDLIPMLRSRGRRGKADR